MATRVNLPGLQIVGPEKTTAVKRDRLIAIDEVEELTGLKKTSIYRLMGLKKFPRNVSLSTKCVRWPESAVFQWIQDRITEANAEQQSGSTD